MKRSRQRSLKIQYLKELSLTFLLPFLAILALITAHIYRMVKEESEQKCSLYVSMLSNQMADELSKYVAIVETAAMQTQVQSMDYTQAEPYLQSLIALEGNDVWSHFLIANQYGTEQAHTEGKDGHGYSIRTEDAFSIPWKEQKTYVSEPVISISTGRTVLGIGTPIYRNGKECGVLIGYLRLEAISNILNQYHFTDGSYAFMTGSDGTIAAHPDQSLVMNTNIRDLKPESGSIYSSHALGLRDISICLVTPLPQAYAMLYSLLRLMGIAVLALLVVGISGTLLLSSRTARLLQWIVRQTSQLSQGNTALHDQKLPYGKTRDILCLKNAMQTLALGLEAIFSNLKERSGELEATVNQVSEHVAFADSSIGTISQRMSRFAQAIQEVSDAAELLRNKSSQNLNFATAISEFSNDGKRYTTDMMTQAEAFEKNAQNGKTDSLSMLETIRHELNLSLEESKKAELINELAEEIMDISHRTNMLSLNASIEAARAGSAGRGFSVVATQIRTLASGCQQTAEHIRQISQTVTRAVSSLCADAETLMSYIDTSVTKDYGFFMDLAGHYCKDASEITSMMNRFADHAEQLRSSFATMDENISGISAAMETNHTGITEIAAYTQELTATLHGINDETGACSHISRKLLGSLEQFHGEEL